MSARVPAVLSAALLLAGPARAAPGDTCAAAIDITALPFMASGTSCGAGNDFTNASAGTAVCADLPSPYGGEDVFYKLILAAGNKVGFELTMPAGAAGDLALFLVRQPGCADPPVCAGSSVDLIGPGVGTERIKPQGYPPGTYYLVVDSALAAPDPAQCGAYQLAVTGSLSEFCGNGMVEKAELCDDGNNLDGDCCSADCQIQAPSGTTCRPAAGACDLDEACDATGRCPADQLRGAGTVCRMAAGPCDLVESCTGTTAACPADQVSPIGPLCRSPAGPCDQAEFCDGVSGACPTDQMLPAGTPCALATACSQAALCAGSAAACPPPAPTSCDDGNLCTQDSCDMVNGCLHLPICKDGGADGPADASPDASVDAPPDAAVDAAAPDAPSSADAPVVAVDAGARDVGAEAAPADAPRDTGLTADARPADEPMATTPQTLPDGATSLPEDAASGGAVGLGGVGRGMGGALDGGPPGEGGRVTEAGGQDGGLTINKLDGGCSCRLDAPGSPPPSGLAGLLIVLVVVRIARRRRGV